MTPAPIGSFRIYRTDPPDSDVSAWSSSVAASLAARELLRPAAVRPSPRDLEPFSRGWFEEVEIKRYAPDGVWLRRVLEFTRHAGETMLMLGAGLGTDALQYQRHGTAVTVCATPADHPDAIRRNFEQRGLTVRLVHAGPDLLLPFDRGTFDLAYLNLLHDPPADLPRVVGELYRVLKPGGKLFALAPARYDATFYGSLLRPFRHWCRPSARLTDAPHYSGSALRQVFAPFEDRRFTKRHLRRSELPYLWRFVPMILLERVMGRILAVRAFKPVSAAFDVEAIESAA